MEEDVFLTQNCIASDSDLNLNEIWRNKGEKDDVFLSRCINDTKSSQEITTRKPSSYFRPYPDYKALHNAVVGAKKVSTAKKLLLTNGNLFRKHIVINNQSIIVRNTCSFDAVVQILTVSAIDYEKYLNHIVLTQNKTCDLIIELIISGVNGNIYLKLCSILQNFVPQENKTASLRVVDVTTTITNMWNFIMTNEPSMFRIKSCECGYRMIQEVSIVCLNTRIIQSNGYNYLEEAIDITGSNDLEKYLKKDCPRFIQEDLKPNAHIFIDTECFAEDEQGKLITMTCIVTDLPVGDITLLGEKMRFVK